MQKVAILTIPSPSTAAIRDPGLRTDGSDLLLSMEFDHEGEIRSDSLRFVKQRAFRKRAESHCAARHVADSYDTVCEVEESDWIRELRSDSTPRWRDYWVMRHFIIYVDSFGCLEVIAESVVLEATFRSST